MPAGGAVTLGVIGLAGGMMSAGKASDAQQNAMNQQMAMYQNQMNMLKPYLDITGGALKHFNDIATAPGLTPGGRLAMGQLQSRLAAAKRDAERRGNMPGYGLLPIGIEGAKGRAQITLEDQMRKEQMLGSIAGMTGQFAGMSSGALGNMGAAYGQRANFYGNMANSAMSGMGQTLQNAFAMYKMGQKPGAPGAGGVTSNAEAAPGMMATAGGAVAAPSYGLAAPVAPANGGGMGPGAPYRASSGVGLDTTFGSKLGGNIAQNEFDQYVAPRFGLGG